MMEPNAGVACFVIDPSKAGIVVRTLFGTMMYVHVYSIFVLSRIDTSLQMGLSPSKDIKQL
jgi:hypothetical protein